MSRVGSTLRLSEVTIVVPSLKRRLSVKPPFFFVFLPLPVSVGSAPQPLASEAARRRAGPPPKAGPAQAAVESAHDGPRPLKV
jgi:hypothetical protein